MNPMLAQIEPVYLLSVVKPVVFLIVLVIWGRIVGMYDKDAGYFYLHRRWWAGGHLAAGALGMALMLVLPYFIIGLLLGVAVMGGEAYGYFAYRNTQVPDKEKWVISLDMFRRKFSEYQHAQAERRATVVLLSPDETQLEVPGGSDEDGPAHQTLEGVMNFALPRGADRIDLLVDAEQVAMSVRIDGVRYPQDAPEPQVAARLIDYLKRAAGLDVSDRRKKQTGQLKVDAEEYGRTTMELETYGSTRGLSLTLTIAASVQSNIPLEHLGLLKAQERAVRGLFKEKGGVVIIAAPPRQGTTTTLYSLIQEHDAYTSGVMTLEDEVFFDVEGVNHQLIEPGTSNAAFNQRLAALLRSDPDVLMLSRIADAKTTELICKSAEDVRFYLPLARDDTFAALELWTKAVGDRRQAAEGLGGILSQRLLRKLCTTCRVSYEPDKAALKKMNLPTDKVSTLYRSSGQVLVRDKPQACPNCMGLGYRGRVGVFEVMALDPAARGYIGSGEAEKLRAHLRKNRMLYLQEAALAKVVEGVTDIKEVTRALGGGGKSGSDGGQKASKAKKTPGSAGGSEKAAKASARSSKSASGSSVPEEKSSTP